MNEPLTEEEILLNSFFDILDNLKESKSLKTIKELFVQKDEKMIPLIDFRSKLLLFGFEENSEISSKIIKKYTPLFDRSVISIENMCIEYQIYLEKKDRMKEIQEKQKTMMEIKEKNSNKVLPNTAQIRITTKIDDDVTEIKAFSNRDNHSLNNNDQQMIIKSSNPNSNLNNQNNNNFTNNNLISNNHIINQNANNNNNNYYNLNDQNNHSPPFQQTQYQNQNNYNNNRGSNPNNLNINMYNNNNESDLNRHPTFGKPNSGSNNELNVNNFNSNGSLNKNSNANFNYNINPTKKKEILEKLEKLDKKLLEELKSNVNYIKTKIYENFFNFYKVNEDEIENVARRLDRKKTGFLDEDLFNSLLDEILVLSDNEKKIILMDLERNQAGNYSYFNFIEKIKNFNLEDLNNQVKSFNHSYNDYIVKLRNFFKQNSLDLLETWKECFKENPKIDYVNFKTLLNNINYPPLYEEENLYLFNKLSDDGKMISYKKLNFIIKMIPPNRDNINKKLDDSISKSSNVNNDNSYVGGSSNNLNNIGGNNNYNYLGNKNDNKIINNNDLVNNFSNNNTKGNNNLNNYSNNKNEGYESDPDINFKIPNANKNMSINSFKNNNNNSNFNNTDLKDKNNYNEYNKNINNNNYNTANKVNPYFEETAAARRSSVRHADNFREIQSLSAEDSKKIIYQRLSEVDNRIRFLMENLETHKLYQIYSMLKDYFYKMGNQHVFYFNKRDLRRNGYLSEIDFNMAFTEMRIDLTKEQREIMIKSIKNRTQTHYFYFEFLQNVYNFNPIEFEKMYKYCHQNYNDYIVELRMLLKENNLNISDLWNNILGKMNSIDEKMFVNFLNNFDFNFSHEEEYKYLFNIMAAQDGFLDKNHFIELMNMDPPEIDKFQESFQLKGNEGKVNMWKFKISNYTEQSAKLHSKNYMHLQNFFKEIHDNSIKKGFSDLVSYFSNIEVNSDGECAEADFINLLSQIAVRNSNYIMILGAFQNHKNNQLINLIKFFNAYYSFYYYERNPNVENNSNANKINNNEQINKINSNSSSKINSVRTNDLLSPKNNNQTENNFSKTNTVKNQLNVPNLDIANINNDNNYNKNSNNKNNYNTAGNFNQKVNNLQHEEDKNIINSLNLADIKPNRHVTSSDYMDIKDSINFILDIIINEKFKNVEDFFNSKDIKKQGYITLAEFNNIMRDELQINIDEEKDTLELIYSYLVDEKKPSIIKISRLIEVSKDMAEDIDIEKYKKESHGLPYKDNNNTNNQTHNKNNTQNNFAAKNLVNNNANQNNDLKKEPHYFLLRDFAKYLNNNRIRFSTLFPNINEKTQVITIFDFQNCFRLAKYPITPDDINLLTKYFDPYNKNTISLETLKENIKKFEPEYFTKPFQLINQGDLKKNYSLVSKINENPKLVEIIILLNNYIQDNKLTLEEFALKISKSGTIKRMEFIQGIMDTIGKKMKDFNNLIRDAGILYDLMDKNKNENLEKNELIFYLNNAQLTLEERSKKVSITKKMKDELHQLFDFFDVDRDDKISKEDFFKALKSLNHNTTYKDAEILIKQMDSDGNNLIDRKEFVFVMEEKIQHQMVLAQEERDYVIKLFKEEDIDKVGFLTIQQLKHLLNEKLKCNLSDDEFMELVDKTDCNYDGLIDIEEFVNLLDMNPENAINLGNNNNKENLTNEHLSKTLRQINAKRKINPMQFLSIFNGLPMNFIPSFIKEEQKLLKLLPSAALIPATDETGILYKDILPDSALPTTPSKSPKSFTNTGTNLYPNSNAHNNNIQGIGMQTGSSSKNSVFNLNNSGNIRLRPISTQINTKISFDKATGVSIPDEKMLDRQKNIVGRIVKITFYDEIKNSFFGNSIQIEATWKKEYEDRWYFDEDRKSFNNNILIRYNDDNEKRKIYVIFEFVITMMKEGIITETSCGWCSCDIKNLYKPAEIKLPIYGGTPFKQEMINRTDVRTKRSGWAKFTQIFSGQIKSELPIKIKPFKELSNPDKVN